MDRHILCVKQPVLDANQALHSYSYVLQAVGHKPLTDQAWEDEAHALFRDLQENGSLDALAGPNYCFYRVPYTLLKPDVLPPVEDRKRLVIEIDRDILGNRDALAHLKSLHSEGLQIALHDYHEEEAYTKLLSVARFVKLNLKTLGEAAAIKLYHQLKEGHIPIVTHVEDEAQFLRLKEEGVELFQGYYFVNPVVSAHQELSPNEAALLQLVAELNNDDTDFDRLAEIISTDVALSHQLLAAINHPSNDLPREVTSIEDAVQLMGLKRLKFWVTIMLLSRAEGVPEELLKTALTRGKFMETLAEHAPTHTREKDAFFLVGLFSTLNAFFHLPMQDLVDQLPLAAPLKKALTDYEGSMGQALRIAKSLEQGSTDLMSLRFEHLDIMRISDFYLTASAWASKILHSAG